MKHKTAIVLFRRDLRLRDNPALFEASRSAGKIIPLFIWDPQESSPLHPGAASKWWLHHSLKALQEELRKKNSNLFFVLGENLSVLRTIIAETKSEAVYWNRLYEPRAASADRKMELALEEDGIAAFSFNSSLLLEPDSIKNSSDKPFQVFTPFWKRLSSDYHSTKPLPAPRILNSPKKLPHSVSLSELNLLPEIDWTSGLVARWNHGEEEARKTLKKFISLKLSSYSNKRDFPAVDGVSNLSPYLHFGEIGVRSIWHEVEKATEKSPSLSYDLTEPFLRQLAWREFAHHLLFHFPHTEDEPLKAAFLRFPWKTNKAQLRAWQCGQTGYPIVDAGMRELWHSGTMHNRVRMIAASFLVKDLLQPWQSGAAWFWDTLVDADLANNTLGWQWVAGCGADAAPYFRIFNPTLQGERFDPHGDYIKRWVPELAKLPEKWIHKPWKCPEAILENTGLSLGSNYPFPIVDHSKARDDALEAYEELKPQ